MTSIWFGKHGVWVTERTHKQSAFRPCRLLSMLNVDTHSVIICLPVVFKRRATLTEVVCQISTEHLPHSITNLLYSRPMFSPWTEMTSHGEFACEQMLLEEMMSNKPRDSE